MNSKLTKFLAAFLLSAIVTALPAISQTHGVGGAKAGMIKEGLGRTWKGPSTTVIAKILTRRGAGKSTTRAASASGRRPKTAVSRPPVPPASVVTFRPSGNSGVAELFASSFSSNASEKATLLELFSQVKQGYETEVAKDGKSNDLAAALTFFLLSNIVAYNDSEVPTEAATEEVYVSLREAMNTTPEIARMTNAEKQQMHDWLVYLGGFVLTGYTVAKQTNDKASMKTFREVAELSSNLIGVDLGQLDLSKR